MPGLQIERITSKGQLVPLLFTQDAVAASQSDAQLKIIETGATSGTLANDEYPMPFKGEVVGISWTLSAAATAGSLTIGVTNGGTEDADTTQTVTTATRGTAAFKRGKMVFAAGDPLGVEITTSAGWDATTADLAVVVYALVDVGGI